MTLAGHIRPVLVAASLLVAPIAARGADGVVEINQACAVQTGCFSGDAAGFPVVIDGSAGLSYRLTSDLVLPDTDTTGINVTSPDVAIDLGGFKIVATACVGATSSCRPSSGSGIGVFASPLGLRLRGGDIIGMGSGGVVAGGQARLEALRVSQSGQAGIALGGAAIVKDVASFSNGSAGISVGSASSVSGSSVVSNLGDGIFAGAGSVVIENNVRNNGATGLNLASSDAGYSENTITNNGSAGVLGGTNLGNNLCVGAGVSSVACP